MKRYEIFFSGRVQGVGFRYTSKQVARSFDLVGTVENLSDGRVKMVLEGEIAVVEGFIREVCDSIHGHVAEVKMTSEPATGKFVDFEIIH
jgi:acylphosphatase